MIWYVQLAIGFLLMTGLIFTGVPVFVAFLIERLGPRYGRILSIGCVLVSALVCLLSIWFTSDEVHRQFVREVRTIDAMMLPKWWVSVWFIYGFTGATIQFLRHAAGADAGIVPPSATQ